MTRLRRRPCDVLAVLSLVLFAAVVAWSLECATVTTTGGSSASVWYASRTGFEAC